MKTNPTDEFEAARKMFRDQEREFAAEPKRAPANGHARDDPRYCLDEFGDALPGDDIEFGDPNPRGKEGAKDQADEQTCNAQDLDVRDADDDTEPPPPRRWLLGNQFCRRFLSGLVAPGSTGKTALRTLQCLSLAIGRPLTGQHVFKRCRVLDVSLEDDGEEMRRRFLAARLRYGITLADVKGWLFYATPRGIKLVEMKNGSRQLGKLEKQLRAAIERYRPDLVVLDPYVKLHALEENDNGAMDFVCDLLATLAIEYDIAIDAPHHTKKGQLTPGVPDAGRGGSAARDAGRLVYTLTVMSEQEATNFGIKLEDRAAYVRLDRGKVNLAPPARSAEWFKLVGVPLDNGNDEYPNGDEVQTVEPWKSPKIWDGLSSETLNNALTDIDQGMPNGQRYTDAGGGKGPRAAWRVVQKHCADRTEGQCREIIRTWIRNGVLYDAEYDDPIERKPRKGYRLDTTKRPS
jgi:AAA domain